MATATRHLHSRIAIVFDFDDTLAPDSFETLLRSLHLDPLSFRKEQVQPLIDDGWDSILARFYTLIRASRQADQSRLTQEHLTQVGQGIDLFDGVPELFQRVRKAVQAIVEDVEVEFYLLTSGFAEIPRATPIANEFTAIWGGEFAFEDGEAVFAKEIITHPEKVRYLLQLAKGLSPSGPNTPADVYRTVPDEEWHVPLDQIIYVGDGASDMPVFGMLHDAGGMAIGVFKGDNVDKWHGYGDINPGRRVENLAEAGYKKDSELFQSIILAVESIGKRLALLQLSQNE